MEFFGTRGRSLSPVIPLPVQVGKNSRNLGYRREFCTKEMTNYKDQQIVGVFG